MINRYKIHRIVEYIKQDRFEFEVDETIHELEKVLSFYHVIDTDLTNDESVLLMQELIPLAEQFEFCEATRLALEEPATII